MSTQGPAKYVLYHYPYSICSIQVRYAFANRGEPSNQQKAVQLEERVIDIGPAREQLSEHFLCDVNSNGEVPVLVTADGSIPESVDITYKLAESYPSMIPKHCEDEVKRLLAKLHQISFFALTFSTKKESSGSKVQGANLALLKDKLQSVDTSERYRKAIQHKINRIQDKKISALTESNVSKTIQQTQDFMAEVEEKLKGSSTSWILDTAEPTALDSHFITFVARLQDVGRDDLVPDSVARYANVAMSLPQWKEVMQGKRTTPPMLG
ncbi:hypothetical protein AC578_1301 [Pseudocercospora eumusae]|uniref:GST N-terminal domain-containing protein n=1 Tax=Pseudocercospora eumusae TaxID=321146 RepID=A0A139HUH4_9PEZI|nr:hypothetical protein AC578_1301 [Pseudocercospora eumusae]